ncbi:MAG: glycosyltransferase family 4 protein, partial [Gemmataceae bacterium]
MNLALCHPYVMPERGGCETYIAELTRWLTRRGHEVHLYAWGWDPAALPDGVTCHRPAGPDRPWRPRRPWLFSLGCLRAMRRLRHDVSVGFDKTFGQDVLYPQGGLHAASADRAVGVERGFRRAVAWARQRLDLAFWSFGRLETVQYRRHRPLVAVNSRMVAGHFERHCGLGADRVRVVPAAI